MQVLRNTPAELRVTFYTDEAPANSAVPVTATAVRDDGTVLATSTATSGGSGLYWWNLSPQPDLDVLTVSWVGEIDGLPATLVTEVEIVDSYYASLAEIRQQGGYAEGEGLDDTARFSTDRLTETRRAAERLFETYCRRAFVPRYGRETIAGNGTNRLQLRQLDIRTVRSLTVDGSPVPTSDLEWSPSGEVVRTDGGTFPLPRTGLANVAITYEHGLPYVPPEIKRAFLTYVRHLLFSDRSEALDRIQSQSFDGVTTTFVQPGFNRATGLADVDSILNLWRRPSFRVGV